MKMTEYDISAVITLGVFLGLYIVQFYLMYRAIVGGWNYRVVVDYNYYNEFWCELVIMILSLPFVMSFSKRTLSGIKLRRSLLKERSK